MSIHLLTTVELLSSLAIMNSAAMNMGMQIERQVSRGMRKHPESVGQAKERSPHFPPSCLKLPLPAKRNGLG